jgi:Glycine rich protein
MRTRFDRARARVGGIGLLATVACMLAPGAAAAQGTATATFTTPGQYEFTVPAGVSTVTVTAMGAAGGSCLRESGGEGALLTGTFAVQPGQQLAIGVGGPGSGCQRPGTDGTGAGGVGGGGPGGGVGHPGYGAGGGGASEVALDALPQSPSPELLLVAAGGGGAGQIVGGAGGDAGSAGQPDPTKLVNGGQPGSATAGGAGGVTFPSTWSGLGGSFGLGGAGGSAPATTLDGGGGGGGYYGGGGGAATDPNGGAGGGGGGGGSSFLAADATDPSGPQVSTATAGVSIAYARPALSLSATSLQFAPQDAGTVSGAQTLTVTNSGLAPLVVSGVSLSGPDAADFLAADLCQAPLAPGASCDIDVRYAPMQAGATSTASLIVISDDASGPSTIALTGTSGTPTSPPQTVSPSGGSAGSVPLGTIVCHKRGPAKTACTLQLTPGVSAASAGTSTATFTLTRNRDTVVHGTIKLRAGQASRQRFARLKPGRYTLTVATDTGRHQKLLLQESIVVSYSTGR